MSSTDLDRSAAASINDSISFSITGNGLDDAKFAITTSGALSFAVGPDFENPTDLGGTAGDNVYLVEVQVEDESGATATETMTVTVNNVTATISGTVFVDADGDGLFDGGSESAIDAVMIELLDGSGGLLATHNTAMGGRLRFRRRWRILDLSHSADVAYWCG